MIHWNEYWKNFDISGYCGGIRMAYWVYHRLKKQYPSIPDFRVEV